MRIQTMEKNVNGVEGIIYIRPDDNAFAIDSKDGNSQIRFYPATLMELKIFIKDLNRLVEKWNPNIVTGMSSEKSQ